MKRSDGLLWALRLGGLLLLGWFLLHKVDFAVIGFLLGNLRWELYPFVVLLTLLCYAVLALRWQNLAAVCGMNHRFRYYLGHIWSAQFLNTFLPGGLGGDIYKTTVLARSNSQQVALSASCVLADRAIALLVLTLLATVGVFFASPHLLTPFQDTVALQDLLDYWPWLAGLVGFVGLSLLIFRQRLNGALTPVIYGLLGGAKALAARPLALLGAAFYSLVAHVSNFGIFYLGAKMLGVPLLPADVMLLMPIVILLSMLPISVNGHGFREALLIAYFAHRGLAVTGSDPTQSALSASIVYVSNDLLWSLPGAIALLFSSTERKTPPS